MVHKEKQLLLTSLLSCLDGIALSKVWVLGKVGEGCIFFLKDFPIEKAKMKMAELIPLKEYPFTLSLLRLVMHISSNS